MRLYVRRVTFAFWVEMGLRAFAICLLTICLYELSTYDPDFHGGVVAPFYGMISAMLIMNMFLLIRAGTLQTLRYRLGELPEDPWWGRNVESVIVFYADWSMIILSSVGPLVWSVHLGTFRPISSDQGQKCRPYPHFCAVMDYSDMLPLQKITHFFWGVTALMAPCAGMDVCHFLWAVKIRKCRPQNARVPLLGGLGGF